MKNTALELGSANNCSHPSHFRSGFASTKMAGCCRRWVFMRRYPLIESTLGGIYGAQTFRSDEHAMSQLSKDLSHEPFKTAFVLELEAAFSDPQLSWVKLLDDSEVASVESEAEAIGLARKLLWLPVFGEET